MSDNNENSFANSDRVYEGTVIWFDSHAGYGFIEWSGQTLKAAQSDMFVHFSDINSPGFKNLKKNQKVTFKIGTNNRGQPKAVDVTVIE